MTERLGRSLAADFRHWHRTLRERHLRPYVFIHINKTGGSSIERALGIRLDHSTALEKYRQLGAKAFQQKFRFTVVRNPFDKVVSHYSYRIKTNQTGMGDGQISFDEWLQRCYRDRDPALYDKPRMFMPQRRWLVNEEDEMLVEFVGRFEQLQQDFETVCKRLGTQAELGHAKASDRGDYRDFYNSENRRLIEQAFAEDLDTFAYSF